MHKKILSPIYIHIYPSKKGFFCISIIYIYMYIYMCICIFIYIYLFFCLESQSYWTMRGGRQDVSNMAGNYILYRFGSLCFFFTRHKLEAWLSSLVAAKNFHNIWNKNYKNIFIRLCNSKEKNTRIIAKVHCDVCFQVLASLWAARAS